MTELMIVPIVLGFVTGIWVGATKTTPTTYYTKRIQELEKENQMFKEDLYDYIMDNHTEGYTRTMQIIDRIEEQKHQETLERWQRKIQV